MNENSETRFDEEELEWWSAGREARLISDALASEDLAVPGERDITRAVIASRHRDPDAVARLKGRLRCWQWSTGTAIAACLTIGILGFDRTEPESGGSRLPGQVRTPVAKSEVTGSLSSRLEKTREKVTKLSSRQRIWNARLPGSSVDNNKPANNS